MTLVQFTIRDADGTAYRYLEVTAEGLAAITMAKERMVAAVRAGDIVEMVGNDHITPVFVCTRHVLSFAIKGIITSKGVEA